MRLSYLANLARTEYGTKGDLTWTTPGSSQAFNGSGTYSQDSGVNSTVSFIGIEKPKDVERIVKEQISRNEQMKKNPNGDSNVQY